MKTAADHTRAYRARVAADPDRKALYDARARYTGRRQRQKPEIRAYQKAYSAAWQAAHPLSWATWASKAVQRAKTRAKGAGVPFDLSPADVYIPATCPVFGRPFVLGVVGHPDSPSLDRIKPALGYVNGNVAVISRRANFIKNDATSAEIMAVALWTASVGT